MPYADGSLEVLGVRELRRQAKRAGVDLGELKDAHRAAAELVVAHARTLAPVVSGRLRDSIRAGATKTAAAVRAGNNGRVPYVPPVHWGWPARRIEANPFLTQAAQDTETRWTELYLRAVDQVLEQIKGVQQ